MQIQDVHPGDIIAVLATGAYNYAMSSNYNRIPRPPVVMLRGGQARVVVKRETYPQFFDSGLIDVCNQLANNGIRVIVAGLDMDFRGIPFGPMPGLCAIADEVSKVHAICVKCGQLASFSHRTVKNDKQVLLGETEEYEPLCRECYQQAIQADQKESGH